MLCCHCFSDSHLLLSSQHNWSSTQVGLGKQTNSYCIIKCSGFSGMIKNWVSKEGIRQHISTAAPLFHCYKKGILCVECLSLFMKISENSYAEHYSYHPWLLYWQYFLRLMGADLQQYVVDQIYFIPAVNKADILDESPSCHSLYFLS